MTRSKASQFVVASTAALIMALMPPAAAHVQVDETFPASGGSACIPIGKSWVDYNGPIVAGDLLITRRSDGVKVSKGEGDRSEGDNTKLVVGLKKSKLKPGKYKGHWEIIAGDGDPQEGNFRFRLKSC